MSVRNSLITSAQNSIAIVNSVAQISLSITAIVPALVVDSCDALGTVVHSASQRAVNYLETKKDHSSVEQLVRTTIEKFSV